jgi:hypothetical protein
MRCHARDSVIARSVSDEAIQKDLADPGLLRFARNDGNARRASRTMAATP